MTNLAWGTMLEMASLYWRCEDVEPVCLNTAHSHAAGVVALAAFTLGATNVVMLGFDALEVLRAIERYKVTHLYLPPRRSTNCLRYPVGQIRLFEPAYLAPSRLAGLAG